MLRAALPAALGALLLAGDASAKYVSGSFHLDAGDFLHGPEYEIAKFSFLPGKATISGKVTYKTADSNWMTSPALYLFNDDAWGARPHPARSPRTQPNALLSHRGSNHPGRLQR
jgi:hypothetical protein